MTTEQWRNLLRGLAKADAEGREAALVMMLRMQVPVASRILNASSTLDQLLSQAELWPLPLMISEPQLAFRSETAIRFDTRLTYGGGNKMDNVRFVCATRFHSRPAHCCDEPVVRKNLRGGGGGYSRPPL